MKKYLLALLFLISALPFLRTQNNALSFVYAPAITKMRMNDVKEFGDNVFVDYYKVWYETKKPTKSAYGYNLGFVYKRTIKKKISLELGIFRTILATNSGNFYQVKGLKNYHPDYGGVEYNLTYEGLEMPLNLYYQLYLKKKVMLELNTGVSFNLMGQFRVEEHLIDKITGDKYKTYSHLHISDPRLSRYLEKFEDKYFQRIGFCLGLKFTYHLSQYWSISSSPIVKYYSNALEKSYAVEALRADIFLFGLQSQINFKF